MKRITLAFGWFLYKLPRFGQRFLGNFLGFFVWLLWKRRREIALENVRQALPGQDAAKIVRRSFQHFGGVVVELVMLPWIRPPYPCWLKSDDLAPFHEILETGRGVTLLTAHFGNWEYLPIWSLMGLPLTGIYQIQHQKTADEILYMLRSSPGLELTSSRYGVKEAFRVLKSARVLGSVGDQGQGIRVPFFGRMTSFPVGPARMALKTKTPILFCAGIREREELHLKILGEVSLDQGEDENEILYNASARFAGLLEDEIRRHPEQYFWMHRIWKHDEENPPKENLP